MPGLHIDEVGGNLNIVKPFNYSDLKNLVDNNLLIPGQKYLVTDYLHQYAILGSDSGGKVQFHTQKNYAFGYATMVGGYDYTLYMGQRCVVDSLPPEYTGNIKVGDETTVTAVSSNFYFQFANGMHSIPNLVFKTYKKRYESLDSDIILLDDYGKPIMKPGGIINTEVHDGTPYIKHTAAENKKPELEQIILTAIDKNRFSPVAFSNTYEGDIIEYDFFDTEIFNDNRELIGSRKGYILKRKNESLKIDLPIDWRNNRFRRWQLDQDSQLQLLNQHEGTANNKLASEGKFLFSAANVKVGDDALFYVAVEFEGELNNLDKEAHYKKFTYSCDVQNCKDFTIFPLNENFEPVNVNRCEIQEFENTVFVGNESKSERKYPLEYYGNKLFHSTFISNPIIGEYEGYSKYIHLTILDNIRFACTKSYAENLIILSHIQSEENGTCTLNDVIIGGVQKGDYFPGDITPGVYWLYLVFNDASLKEVAIGGAQPFLYILDTKLIRSSIFMYLSRVTDTIDSRYTREVLKINDSMFSQVVLLMTGIMERVRLNDLHFTDENPDRDNGYFNYKVTESFTEVEILKNQETNNLYRIDQKADYSKEYIDVAIQEPNPIDLSIDVTVDNQNPVIGENVIITLTAAHLSGSPGTNVIVQSLLTDGYNFVSSDNADYDNVTGVWNIGDLVTGTSQTLNITATVTDTGNYNINAEISSSEKEINPADNIGVISIQPTPAV